MSDIDKGVAQKAVDMVTPAVFSMMVSGMIQKKMVHVVVCSPDFPCRMGGYEGMKPEIVYDDFISYEDEVAVGQFAELTYGVAVECWQAGCSSDELKKRQQMFTKLIPALNISAAVYMDGLVVACTGAKEYINFMIASWVGAACVALSVHKVVEELLIEQKANAPTW